jgi:hypothetical protein
MAEDTGRSVPAPANEKRRLSGRLRSRLREWRSRSESAPEAALKPTGLHAAASRLRDLANNGATEQAPPGGKVSRSGPKQGLNGSLAIDALDDVPGYRAIRESVCSKVPPAIQLRWSLIGMLGPKALMSCQPHRACLPNVRIFIDVLSYHSGFCIRWCMGVVCSGV